MNPNETQTTSNVAWFKLANLIEKKEKEKALNVFRLLTHSLKDKAYTLQLEGDILWSLNEISLAKEKYTNSAFLYQKDMRWIYAVALYENLLTNDAKNYTYLTYAALCYGQLGWENKFEEKLDNICELVKQNKTDTQPIKQLATLANELESEAFRTTLYTKIQFMISILPAEIADKIEYMFKKV